MLLKFVKDPLVHFLALGCGFFLLFWVLNPEEGIVDDPKRIVVDRDGLLTFIQYRSKTFQPKLAAARLAALSDGELNRLIEDYVREEALHREALSLGLGRDDYVIKRRMIQKIDFITQGFADAVISLSDDDINTYYKAHKERYRQPAFITFTQVFFSTENRSAEAAKALAEGKLAELRNRAVAFSDAPKHGERFPYGVNYVERTEDHVASHFGPAMTMAIFTLDPTRDQWAGPYFSPFGAHLVLVAKRQDTHLPPLKSVRGRIEADLRSERKKELADKAARSIIDTYQVEVDLKKRN